MDIKLIDFGFATEDFKLVKGFTKNYRNKIKNFYS